jgi:hypothetical protein
MIKNKLLQRQNSLEGLKPFRNQWQLINLKLEI